MLDYSFPCYRGPLFHSAGTKILCNIDCGSHCQSLLTHHYSWSCDWLFVAESLLSSSSQGCQKARSTGYVCIVHVRVVLIATERVFFLGFVSLHILIFESVMYYN